jgi:hypothetical protein
LDRFPVQTSEFKRKREILGDGHLRIQRVILKHHRNVAFFWLQLVHHAAVNRTRGDRLEPRHHSQQRRLAATGWADKDDELAIRNVDRHPIKYRRGPEIIRVFP